MKLFFGRKKDGPVVAFRHSGSFQDPYRRSNSVSLEFRPNDEVRQYLSLFKEAFALQDEALVIRTGQNFIDEISFVLGIPVSPILEFKGNRPSRRRVDPKTGKSKIASSIHGKYYLKKNRIELYAFTATGRRVAYKTLLNTLLHEFCHHMDYHHPTIALDNSLHTKGFYQRLNAIYSSLKDL